MTMDKQKTHSFFTSRITLCIATCFAAFAPWLYHCCRIGHVFVDMVLFDGFCQILFWLMVLNALLGCVIMTLRLINPKIRGEEVALSKDFCKASIVVFSLTAFFTVVWIVFLIVMGVENAPVAGKMLGDTCAIALPIISAEFFALVFPFLPSKKAKLVVLGMFLFAGMIGLVSAIYPFTPYKFVADPMVIDTGEDYSVVFATTDSGTGYIEYSYGGETYKIYDTEGGRKVNGQIHSIRVPYEHLNGNVYRIGATRVIDELSYGGRTGKTVVSKDYSFKRQEGAQQKVLCLSDWHIRNNLAYKAVEHIEEYNLVILLGDSSAGLTCEEEAVQYIVKFGGDVSGGIMPVIYTRGNHETRGQYAPSLLSALGLDSFYMDLTLGDYRFIVLDSVEDKDDSHPEYGGMTDYNYYRTKMVEWLETLTPDTKTTIALSHDVNVCREEDLSARAYAKLKEIGAKVVVGGHTHNAEMGEKNGLSYYMDGGHKDGDYVATLITLDNGKIHFTAVNTRGETVAEYSIS